MRVFVKRNSRLPGRGDFPIHGMDYIKGLEQGERCGFPHEYTTRKCRPVFYLETDLTPKDLASGDYIELIYFHERNAPEIRAAV